MLRPAVCVSLLSLAVSCARTAPRPPTVAVAARTGGPPLSFVPAWREEPILVALPDGAVGILLGGARVRYDPSRDAVDAAPDAAPVALREVRPLARAVVFRDEAQRLWRADSFLGPLTAFGEGAASVVSRATPGASLALRRGGVVSITDGREEFTPTGLSPDAPFELTFCDARRGFARAADGLVDATDDGGHTWAPSTDARAVCEVPSVAAPTVRDAVLARARAAALAATPSLLDALGAVVLDDGRAIRAGAEAVVVWRDGRSTATIVRAAGCEVAPWGDCAAILCGDGAPTLQRVCAGGDATAVAHGCRGAFVFSDDGRHALCATASLAVRLLDAAGGERASPLPFGALARATLHGAEALAVEGSELLTAAPDGPVVRAALSRELDAVARMDDGALVGHAGDVLYWRPRDGGAWQRVDAVPAQPFGGGGSRFLARGDLSPAPPRFACGRGACRFGAAVLRHPEALPAASHTAPDAPGEPAEAFAPPAVIDEATLARCAATGPLTRRRPLQGLSLDGVVHAAVDLRAGATFRWITAAGLRAVTLPAASLPGALSPGDDPEVAFPQGVPAAVAEADGALYLATGDGRVGATLWRVAGDAPPRATSLPRAFPPEAGEAVWEGTAVDGGGVFVTQRVIVDDVAIAHAWVVAPDGAVTADFEVRARELPFVAMVDGAPGVVTWMPRAGGAVDVAFRGATTARRWRAAAGAVLSPCGASSARGAWADVPVDLRVDRAEARVGTAERAVLRVTRARVGIAAEGLCVERIRGASGAPAANGRGLFAADVLLEARDGALAGHELDGLRALPFRCAPR